MRVLIIAYYFDPYQGVGAKRVSYWANNLHRHAIGEFAFSCDVVTATDPNQTTIPSGNIFHVKDQNNSLLSKIFRTDKGASWIRNLNFFLKQHLLDNKYDVAIITGNPFLHFFVVNTLRKNGVRTVLDFRDPFATNPRSIDSKNFVRKWKDYVLEQIEYFFVKSSDRVVTVNKYCCKLINGYSNYSDKFRIIDNGYDEQIIDSLPDRNPIRTETVTFGYAGSLYNDRNPTNFLNQVDQYGNFQFHHIGSESEFLKARKFKKAIQYGHKSYFDTLCILKDIDICMIFTSGSAFESTTKIFDYIALEKMIWIITEGSVKTGALHDITKNYPNTIWSRNTLADISDALEWINNSYKVYPFPDKIQFSRAYGLNLLVDELKKLEEE